MWRWVSCALLIALVGCGGDADPDPSVDMSSDMSPDMSVVTDNPREFLSLGALLTYYRKDGCVDYRSMRQDAEARVLLASAQRVFKDHSPATLPDKPARLAYWINAYNTFMLQAAVDHYDLFTRDSVLAEIEGQRIFAKKRFEAGGLVMSLDMLEQGILRRDSARLADASPAERAELDRLAAELYGDDDREVRIHFAVNCAARGCPPLAPSPYVAATLEATLEAQTRAFLNDAARGAGPDGTSELVTSYYAQDFIDAAGSVDAYVKGYNASADTTRSLTYDWALAQCP